MNQSKTVRKAGFQGTRNHHQATRTGRLETTPVRRPRVGQRAMPLSTPTLTPILVPWASSWNYKRGSPGADSRGQQLGNTTLIRSRTSILHTTLVFTPVQALRCKIIQTLSPPLDVGPSLARTRINPCVFLHHHQGKGSMHINSLVGVTPVGKTPTVGAPGRGPACFFIDFPSFPDGHSLFTDSALHGDLVWESRVHVH